MKPAPLPAPIRQRINVVAHAAGLLHEDETKARLRAEIEQMKLAGALLPELVAYLARVEAGRIQFPQTRGNGLETGL